MNEPIGVTRCKCGAAVPFWDRRYRGRTCDDCKRANEYAYRRRRSAGNISPRVRVAVIRRDGMVCRHCSRPVRHRNGKYDMEGDTIELDHLISVMDGGHGTIENVIVSCLRCNRRKGRRSAA